MSLHLASSAVLGLTKGSEHTGAKEEECIKRAFVLRHFGSPLADSEAQAVHH